MIFRAINLALSRNKMSYFSKQNAEYVLNSYSLSSISLDLFWGIESLKGSISKKVLGLGLDSIIYNFCLKC